MSERGYYGRPIVKPPAWTDLVPVYFFAGGLAGAAETLAFAERARKNDRLARPLLFAATAGCAVSTFCLIADLRRPERFWHMLRVFNPRSPMSVGVYIFSAFSGSVFLAAGSDLTGKARAGGRVCEAIAGTLGPLMSVYTSVLIGDTVIPAWRLPRNSLAALFAATSASSAGGAGLLFAPARNSESARRLGMTGALAGLAALQALKHEIGAAQYEAYASGEAGALARAARALNIGGIVCAAFAKNSHVFSKIAGGLFLAGGLAERFAVYRAGVASAKDPKFVLAAQQIGPS